MRRTGRRRRAIAEVTGALLMIAVTLIAGVAAFSFINNQAKVSEAQYGQSVAGGVNFLREHFTIVTTQFTGTGTGGVCGAVSCTTVNFWVFNNGQLNLTIWSIIIQTAPTQTPVWSLTFKSASYLFSAGCTIPAIVPSQLSTANLLPVNQLSSTPYSVTIPACSNYSMLLGQSYIMTLVGLYGNTVQVQLSANG